MSSFPIFFCKMHGLGNDFVVMHSLGSEKSSFDIKKIPIASLADRHLGIGFDQLLWISQSQTADFSCRFFNADGSEAEQCGNGIRCAARLVHEKKFTEKKSFAFETLAGIIPVTIQDYDHIQVNMGSPVIESLQHTIALTTPLSLMLVSMGNPHAILLAPSIEKAPVQTVGAEIATHPTFSHGINVGFMEYVNRQHIRLRTYERGVGETFACGSNACAAVVAGIAREALEQKVRVELRYGNLWIEWQGGNTPVIMTGPAANVFEGKY